MATNRAPAVEVKELKKCSEKEDALARHVALTTNTLGACYIEAGYKDQKKQNRVKACHTLARPHVQARVDYYRQMAAAKLDLRTERIMAETAAIAFLDPIDIFDTSAGTLVVKDLEEIPPWARRAIASLKETHTIFGEDGEERSIEVKFHPKMQALNMLAKIKNLFEENNKSQAPRVQFDLRFLK